MGSHEQVGKGRRKVGELFALGKVEGMDGKGEMDRDGIVEMPGESSSKEERDGMRRKRETEMEWERMGDYSGMIDG